MNLTKSTVTRLKGMLRELEGREFAAQFLSGEKRQPGTKRDKDWRSARAIREVLTKLKEVT
jgi:hypothetical protein